MATKATVTAGSRFLSSASFSLVYSITVSSANATGTAVPSVIRCMGILLGGKKCATRGEAGV